MESHITDWGSVRVTLDLDAIDRMIEQAAKDEGLTLEQYRAKNNLDSSSSEEESGPTDDDIRAMLPRMIDLYRKKDGQLSDCMQLLIHDVEARITPANKGAAETIIENAKKEMYHDMLSDLDAPSFLLEKHLRYAGMEDLRRAHTIDGKYDAKPV